MVIYIDLIIIVNFIIDFLLLLGVDLLLKRHTKIVRIFIASLVSSLSTLILIQTNNSYISLLYKIITSIIMILITFKYNSFNYFKENIFYLYILSIILGGFIYLLNDQLTISSNGILYTNNNLNYKMLLLLIGPLIIYKYIYENKKLKIINSNYYQISIYYNDIKLTGTAFLDTGNNLKDPYFKKPIILVNKELIKQNIKTFYVPYDSLNNHNLLEVFKPKKVLINGHKISPSLIGISDINYNGIKIILNKENI